MPNEWPQQRTCIECGSLFITPNSTRKFCHNNCKSAHDRHQKKQQTQQQAQQVQQQAAEINQLKIRPRVVANEMINPDWQQADRRCQAQQSRCHRVAQQVADVRQERRALTRPGWGFWAGAGLGFLLVAWGMALVAEARPRQRSKMSFWIMFIVGVGLLSPRMAWWGNRIEDQQMSDEEKQAVIDKLDRIDQRETTLIEQLETEKSRLESLLMARDEIDPTCPLLAVPRDEAPNAH